MDSQFIAIGRVLAPWGMRGEMKVEVMTDFPDRFSPQQEVCFEGCAMTIETSRWHKGQVILKLATIDSVEAAQALSGRFLEVPLSKLHPLPADEYYRFQLIGLDVLTTGGELLGQIAKILPTGSNDVYVVPTEGGELLIPAIDDVVKSVDLGKACMVIEVIEGLLDRKC